MATAGPRRRALVALRDRELAEAAAGLARVREDLARLEAALARAGQGAAGEDAGPVPAVLLELEDRAAGRRHAERTRLVEQQAAALARVERERQAVARALRARTALD
ncbi:MAG TPA: hypothetical protein VM285_17155 [Polyangia bacterium]|nr:hypothetical protein [Polyangia bacterium]